MSSTNSITAIVLCGGLGTRLRSVSRSLPKPMVPVANRPFLEYILDYLIVQGVAQVVLAVSYKKEVIIDHFGSKYRNLAISYSIESNPLGTGGAVKKAIEQILPCPEQLILIINGDTFVEYSLSDMVSKCKEKHADFVMALKDMDDTSRYGRVKVEHHNITEFEEKKSGYKGLINAGIYLFHPSLYKAFPKSDTFSFENDFLESFIRNHDVQPSISDGYFIDIGVPEDYQKAQEDFEYTNLAWKAP
ncbi:nucleotidyltransferase family protein (plasmid) [Vibrio alfacsensis]|uniref:nucleotidyltransferase family protein n=1 Tax=Vibrio alfacsensis TaxID=1074311 RepID=UPI002ADDB9E7|nr:nucleotidyltransferase family protein [Vibrio alfacsensis]WQE79029.1 nucleotidyltransferase family protein [Vibrio alfacsensis]